MHFIIMIVGLMFNNESELSGNCNVSEDEES